MALEDPRDPFSEVVDEKRRWMPDWYSWLRNLTETLANFFGAIDVDDGGRVVVSDTLPKAHFSIGGATGQVYSNNTGRWSYVAGGFGVATPSLISAFSRNSVPNGHTIVQNGDELLHIAAYGSDGADWSLAATIRAFVDGAPNTNDMPGRWEFATSPDGTEAPVRRLMLDQDGRVVVGGTSLGARLLVGIDQHFSLGGANPNVMSANAGFRYAYVAATFGSTTPAMAFSKSNHATVGSHTIVANGDEILNIAAYGSDGDEYVLGASLHAFVDGTPGNQDMPGRWEIRTTPNGGAASLTRMAVDNLGNVTVNTGAIATNATDGFLYVPTCAGTPTGTPTTKTGLAPIVVDSSNNRLYFYSGGAWRNAGP